MDNNSANSASIETTETTIEVKPKMGRPVGSKKKLGLSIKERLKILESIATSKDPNVKDTDRLGAVKLMTELLADKIDPKERLLPVYTLRFELDKLDKSGKVEDYMPVTASNSPVKVVEVVEPSTDIPLEPESDKTQPADVEIVEQKEVDSDEFFEFF